MLRRESPFVRRFTSSHLFQLDFKPYLLLPPFKIKLSLLYLHSNSHLLCLLYWLFILHLYMLFKSGSATAYLYWTTSYWSLMYFVFHGYSLLLVLFIRLFCCLKFLFCYPLSFWLSFSTLLLSLSSLLGDHFGSESYSWLESSIYFRRKMELLGITSLQEFWLLLLCMEDFH